MNEEYDYKRMSGAEYSFLKLNNCIAAGWHVVPVDWKLDYYFDESIPNWIDKNIDGAYFCHGVDSGVSLAFKEKESAVLFAMRWS